MSEFLLIQTEDCWAVGILQRKEKKVLILKFWNECLQSYDFIKIYLLNLVLKVIALISIFDYVNNVTMNFIDILLLC